ncbi:M20/M25/M40 family metallo-hydrolase [Rhodohalobacter sp. 8-1]|uniref:M20/M25/M40 family metallo-hydrolase n=1 Tax=Rhodohalobacter sp. 8-1 TaxID=3131972 RepID=UPI0030ED9530
MKNYSSQVCQAIGFALFVLLFISCAQPGTEDSAEITVEDHIEKLTDPAYEGRLAGTAGEAAVANYIADQFLVAGLMPAGDEGTYIQQFPLEGPMPQAMDIENYISRNVVGFIEGDGRSGQYIIIAAHYDSQGTGGIISMNESDEPVIHPGADDNASGAAGLLELADYFADNPIQKNMLFIAFSGEELGLLGSRYFVDQMEISPDSIAAMINLDMIGRMTDNELTIFGTGTSNRWDEILGTVKTDSLTITRAASGAGASDHTSFYEAEIPVLHYFTGTHENYHRPSDTADKLNISGIHKVTEHVIAVVEELDSYDASEIEFRESTNPHSTTFDMDGPTLGVLPDYSYSGDGFRVESVRSGDPADRGGMQDGDVIVQMGDAEISDIYGYMEKLSDIEEGDRITVVVRREGEEVPLEIQF